MKEIRIGMIGYSFMGKAHSNAYRQVAAYFDLKAKPVMKAICGLYEHEAKAAAQKYGWEGYEKRWQDLIARDDIDVIDITTPNNVHCVQAIAAAKAGKHILCEKPLASTLAEAKAMLAAAQKAKVKHMVGFNYRRVPALALAKKMIEKGDLGKIFHIRAVYLQDWIIDPEFPLVWRLVKKEAGSGALGDLGAHIIDVAHHLVGDIDSLTATTETFIKERPLPPKEYGGLAAKAASGKKGKVTVDDAALFLARFKNGALGTFEATRFAAGNKNGNGFEINGSKGTLKFNFERMNELEYYNREDPADRQGFRTILVTEGCHKYAGAWWPPGHILGYEHTFVHEVYDFIENITNNTKPSPDFADGVKVQAVLDAVEQSAKSKQWVKVKV
ncbi:MAG TPA: Gfo/Idh/MocA family oxidoreductase [bacterium]|nr:Gfo/Idh/MocA family oxidoreductase [bacterium]